MSRDKLILIKNVYPFTFEVFNKLSLQLSHYSSPKVLQKNLIQCKYTYFFFISNTFISNTRLKLVKNQASTKQHSDTLRLNFSYLTVIHILRRYYQPKIIAHMLKNKQKNKCVFIHEIARLTIMKMKMKKKKRSHR